MGQRAALMILDNPILLRALVNAHREHAPDLAILYCTFDDQRYVNLDSRNQAARDARAFDGLSPDECEQCDEWQVAKAQVVVCDVLNKALEVEQLAVFDRMTAVVRESGMDIWADVG